MTNINIANIIGMENARLPKYFIKYYNADLYLSLYYYVCLRLLNNMSNIQ